MSVQWIQERLKNAGKDSQEVLREELKLSVGCDKEVTNNMKIFYYKCF